jgi:hypothetical protein
MRRHASRKASRSSIEEHLVKMELKNGSMKSITIWFLHEMRIFLLNLIPEWKPSKAAPREWACRAGRVEIEFRNQSKSSKLQVADRVIEAP